MKNSTHPLLLCRTLALAIAVGFAATATAGAEDGQETYRKDYPGTQAQQIACTPDVFRLCVTSMPAVPAIVACLKEHRSELSPDCRAVFDGQLK